MREKIGPDYPPHKLLEKEVQEWLQTRGYMVHESTYHVTMPEELRSILQNRYSLTAIYLRTRADRIAIHRYLPVEFEFECKTHSNQKFNDLTLEAIPFCHHIQRAKIGVRILYIYRIPHQKLEGGFWASEEVRLKEVCIPSRWDEQMMEMFTKVIKSCIPGIQVRKTKWKEGSGDPFVIIPRIELESMEHWQELVKREEELQRAETEEKNRRIDLIDPFELLEISSDSHSVLQKPSEYFQERLF